MELSDIRAKIDAVDDQLLKLFLERMDLADEVAACKNRHHLPILNKERERAVLAKVTENAGTRERYAYHLFSTLFELSRSRQAELINAPTKVGAQVRACLQNRDQLFPQTGLVACQGIEGANSQAACDRLFPRGNILYVKTFDAVVSAVEAGFCKFGVLPIENSSNGSVRAVYQLLQEHSLTIVRSTRLCIRHELLALPGVKPEDVTEIYSHQQAIGQCSRFLDGLKGVKVIPCDNTAVAAKLVAESGSPTAAAISSHPAPPCTAWSALTIRFKTATTTTPASSAWPRIRLSTPEPAGSASSSPLKTSPGPCTKCSPSWRPWTST